MKQKFIPTNNDLSYYPLLYKALEATEGEIIEMGTGHGSTPLLHEYVMKRGMGGLVIKSGLTEYGQRKQRILHSYETEKTWLAKFQDTANDYHTFTLIDRTSWDACSNQHPSPSVVFIDHAPGERRKEDILKFKDKAEIIVIHDTEPAGAGDYQVRQHFSKFKYCVEVMSNWHDPREAGAWATALSNTIDITKWVGEKFGDYTISAWQR